MKRRVDSALISFSSANLVIFLHIPPLFPTFFCLHKQFFLFVFINVCVLGGFGWGKFGHKGKCKLAVYNWL